ncbi:MAG: carbohydrate kinase family protein [Cyclobacteriaceae bacterium]|nr:carbohydrate kinase family protein [Cyclobacteriaceae bacterium]
MNGIIGAGNWILDWTKSIDIYPEQDTLANILSQESNNGGAAYNVLKDLARLGAPFPLHGIGLIGDDEAGQYILEDCLRNGINTDGLQIQATASTSYTDVMLVKESGRRTFFHHRGANAFLDIPHFQFEGNHSKILHLGYLLLLDRLDGFLRENKTRAAFILEMAKNKGLVTSVDLVSESRDRFKKIIFPSLPYIDYLFLNEYEASKLTGIDLASGSISRLVCEKALKEILAGGIHQWVILHFPEGVIAMHLDGEVLTQGSIMMPPSRIIGTTGAGDAFAAGVLFGIHEEWDMARCLELGICAAASSITHASCSDGILPAGECLAFKEKYQTRQLF